MYIFLPREWQSLSLFDRLRLVMPPILFGALQLPFTQLGYVLFPASIANGIISGAFTFCKYLCLLLYSLTISSIRCPL